jgi:hypothetical protein
VKTARAQPTENEQQAAAAAAAAITWGIAIVVTGLRNIAFTRKNWNKRHRIEIIIVSIVLLLALLPALLLFV